MEFYLDTAAHLNLHPKALKAFIEFNGSLAGHGNAMGSNAPGRAAAAAIEESRAKIANLIGAENPNQIIFTSSCTEACCWALELLKNLGLDRVYSSPVEHPAVRYKYRNLFELYYLPISENGVINKNVDYPDNIGIVCLHVQPEIGIIQPIEELKTKYLLSDMSQALGKIPVNVSNIPGLCFACFGFHKIGGSNIGAIYIKDSSMWREYGIGSRYYMDRVSSPDSASIVASAVALEEAVRTFPQRYENMVNFRSVLENGLEELEGFKIIAKGGNRAPGISYIRVPQGRAIQLMNQLAEDGIYIALGSSCGSFATIGTTPPLMAALGIGGTTNDYIRISQFGDYGAQEAKYVLSKIKVLFPNNNGYI